MDAEYGDVVYCTDVCWLNRGKVLKMVFDQKDKVYSFMESKRKQLISSKDPSWVPHECLNATQRFEYSAER